MKKEERDQNVLLKDFISGCYFYSSNDLTCSTKELIEKELEKTELELKELPIII